MNKRDVCGRAVRKRERERDGEADRNQKGGYICMNKRVVCVRKRGRYSES